jgi:L-gulono-1,4-lactone dehydrogenase
VTVRAGSRLRDLNTAFEDIGLAFENLGSTAAQSLAGAVATGTHGTGRELGSISTQLRAIRLVDAVGAVHATSPSNEADLFSAARVGLGALGVVTELTVRAIPLFKMRKTTFSLPLPELLNSLQDYYNTYERFQWSWIPYSIEATVIIREVTDDPLQVAGPHLPSF